MNRVAKLRKRTVLVVQITCLALFVAEKFGRVSICAGSSMFPTLTGNGDLVVIARDKLTNSKIHKGMLVESISPLDPSIRVLKRITALEGECVQLDSKAEHAQKIRIPKGHVWLTGDNLQQSIDSRVYGPVSIALLKGVAKYRIWPSFKRL
ncbi:hypothetical protein BB561_003781 [Smittium simulii]|uniref:Peptidase S26 domain-containing protein n=1 Tax=Smittium simulii TaxID=133385 RepID=A0A2T9YJH2_9FUNG|nr:hypothetical protein BB561_003781 [Smittium simulii]